MQSEEHVLYRLMEGMGQDDVEEIHGESQV